MREPHGIKSHVSQQNIYTQTFLLQPTHLHYGEREREEKEEKKEKESWGSSIKIIEAVIEA